MPSLTIKGIPDKLYRRLKRRALLHRRSLNSEIITCLERVTNAPSIDPEAWLAETDRFRSRLALKPMTEGALRRTRAKGRA